MGCKEGGICSYEEKDGKFVCSKCGYVSAYQPVPSYEELLIEVEQLRRVKENHLRLLSIVIELYGCTLELREFMEGELEPHQTAQDTK